MKQPGEINDKDIEAVLALAVPERYEHTIMRIADWETVYVLE